MKVPFKTTQAVICEKYQLPYLRSWDDLSIQDLLIYSPDQGFCLPNYLIDFHEITFKILQIEKNYSNKYIYITIDQMRCEKETYPRREGIHIDSFGLPYRVNTYIYANTCPTIFYEEDFELTTLNPMMALKELQEQESNKTQKILGSDLIIKLDNLTPHKCNIVTSPQIRVFVKINFCYERFNLEGNTINPLFKYNWQFQPRSLDRNVPFKMNEMI